MGLRFQKFTKRFERHFWRWTRSVAAQARQYLQGLMQARRKNMERMEEVVPDCDYQSLQHFLSDSEWDARAVLDQVAVEADRHLGGSTSWTGNWEKGAYRSCAMPTTATSMCAANEQVSG
jgi:SRSO17 transposase